MSREARRQTTDETLFREAASKFVTRRALGAVSLAMPPSAAITLLISGLALSAIAAATVFVEVPLRTSAIGVLMPPGGYQEVVSPEPGTISRVHVADGQRVAAGELLLEVSADGSNVPGQSRAALVLQALRAELKSRRKVHEEQTRLDSERAQALLAESGNAQRRLQLAIRQLATHREKLSLQEARSDRWQELAAAGHVSRDALAREREQLLEARALEASLEQQRIGFEIEVDRLEQAHSQSRRELELRNAEFALGVAKLRGDIELAEYQHVQGIRAAADGVIARVQVQQGNAVMRGQQVVKLYRPGERLDAWLYISSSSARLLQPGQQVVLQLDAWPREIFGTLTAVVTSVSGIALKPDEVRVPLALPGPVFEVRARMLEDGITTHGSIWPVAPGTTFRAEVIQRRLRLYQWLLRSLHGKLAAADG